MKSNYTRSEVNGFLDDYRQIVFGLGRSTNSYLEQFKKDKYLIPTLELGHYYKDENVPKYLVFFGENGDHYGFDSNGMWFNGNHSIAQLLGWLNNGTPNRLATTEEVSIALETEATRQGHNYKNYTYHFKNQCGMKGILFGWDTLTGGTTQVMDNGKWAKATPKVLELTMSELENKYGCKVKIIKE